MASSRSYSSAALEREERLRLWKEQRKQQQGQQPKPKTAFGSTCRLESTPQSVANSENRHRQSERRSRGTFCDPLKRFYDESSRRSIDSRTTLPDRNSARSRPDSDFCKVVALSPTGPNRRKVGEANVPPLQGSSFGTRARSMTTHGNTISLSDPPMRPPFVVRPTSRRTMGPLGVESFDELMIENELPNVLPTEVKDGKNMFQKKGECVNDLNPELIRNIMEQHLNEVKTSVRSALKQVENKNDSIARIVEGSKIEVVDAVEKVMTKIPPSESEKDNLTKLQETVAGLVLQVQGLQSTIINYTNQTYASKEFGSSGRTPYRKTPNFADSLNISGNSVFPLNHDNLEGFSTPLQPIGTPSKSKILQDATPIPEEMFNVSSVMRPEEPPVIKQFKDSITSEICRVLNEECKMSEEVFADFIESHFNVSVNALRNEAKVLFQHYMEHEISRLADHGKGSVDTNHVAEQAFNFIESCTETILRLVSAVEDETTPKVRPQSFKTSATEELAGAV